MWAEIGFDWSPVDAARAYTCEEDLLAELVGRRTRSTRTERRWTRIDLSLHAGLPYGWTTLMPEPHVFGAWTVSVVKKADVAFTDIAEKKGRRVAVLGGHGDVEVQAHRTPTGAVCLDGVVISGFRLVGVPRVWDDPQRRQAEERRCTELERLAQRWKAALDEWTTSVSELASVVGNPRIGGTDGVRTTRRDSAGKASPKGEADLPETGGADKTRTK